MLSVDECVAGDCMAAVNATDECVSCVYTYSQTCGDLFDECFDGCFQPVFPRIGEANAE